jgi:hypothetical protein
MTNIIQLAAEGRAEDVWRDQRVRAIYSPYYLIKVVLQYNKLVPHLHQHDTELFVDRWASGHTEQAVEWPRAFYKTTTFTIGTGIWIVLPVTEEDTAYAVNTLGIPEDTWFHRVALHDQDATQLYAFEVEDNAKKKVDIVRWHFEENQIFRWLFPEIAYTGVESPWNKSCLRIRRIGARRKDPEGTFEAIGVGGSLQSRHYSHIWCDDLVGEKARKSPSVMSDTIGWYQRLEGAFENATRRIRFLISNRWGYSDLNSWVRENEPSIPFYTRSAWEIDPASGQEVSIFPEEYSLADLQKIQDKLTKYDFSCQYLNSPVMPGEQEVDTAGLHFYEVAEDGTMRCSCGRSYRASALHRYLHYDPYNAKGAGSKSCPALVAVGLSSDEHHFVLDYYTTPETHGKVFDHIFRFNNVWRPRMFTYEDVGHQGLTEHHIRAVSRTTDYKAAGHKTFPRIEGIPTGNRAKEQRIREGLFPVIEKKKFALRRKHVLLQKQLETFPHRVLNHDYDLLDAITQGAMKTKVGGRVWQYPQGEDAILGRNNEEEEYLRHFNNPFSYAALTSTHASPHH